jgi:hypothetical protein
MSDPCVLYYLPILARAQVAEQVCAFPSCVQGAISKQRRTCLVCAHGYSFFVFCLSHDGYSQLGISICYISIVWLWKPFAMQVEPRQLSRFPREGVVMCFLWPVLLTTGCDLSIHPVLSHTAQSLIGDTAVRAVIESTQANVFLFSGLRYCLSLSEPCSVNGAFRDCWWQALAKKETYMLLFRGF